MKTRKIRKFFSSLLTAIMVVSLLPLNVPHTSASTAGISLSDTATGGTLTSGTTVALTAATAGYTTPPADTVTVTNTGSVATGMLELILTGTNAGDFLLSKAGITDIPAGSSDSFTLEPNTGLPAGTYTAMVTVSGSSITVQSFEVSFLVNSANKAVHLVHQGVTTDYDTIQEAIDASVDGDTITLDAGTFREQLTVTKNITLQGAGIGQTVIESPDTTALLQSGGSWRNLKKQDIFAVIGIKTTGNGTVTVKDLTVDGRNQGDYPAGYSRGKMDYTFQGIGAYNSNVTIDTVEVKRVRELSTDSDLPSDYLDQPSGYNHNEGIFAESAAGAGTHVLTVTDSYITQFQKTAILAWGPTLVVDINNNTIQGYGKTLHSSGNGIQISSSNYSGSGGGDRRGTTGSIVDNQILGIGQVVPEPGNPGSYLNLGQGGSNAIILYEAGQGVLISGNTIAGTGDMPWFNADTTYEGNGFTNDAISVSGSNNVIIRDNMISGFFAAVIEGWSNPGSVLTLSGNTFSGNGIDVWASEGNDAITLGTGAETIGYGTSNSGDGTISCGTDMLRNFGTGDRIHVIGYVADSVNGMTGSQAVTAMNTVGATTVIGYTDAQPVVDFTGGTVTNGDGSNVASHSIQLSVTGNTTSLYIDTDGTEDAAELSINLEGVYTTEHFSLDKGYISYVTPFVPVMGISGVPTTATAGTDLALTGTVAPAYATGQTIVWSIKSPGTTGASISGNTLHTTGAGTVTVTATIGNGIAAGTPYIQDFTITVSAISGGNPPGGGSAPTGGSNPADSSKVEKITVEVKEGNTSNTASNITIQRTTGENGQKSDLVNYEKEKAVETVNRLKAAGKDTARIVIPDEKDQVSDTKVNIPLDTVKTLVDGAVNLQIDTEEVKINLSKESLSNISKTSKDDLYFRLVPVKNEIQRETAVNSALLQAVLISGNTDSRVAIIGNPITIETNMQSAEADITLPLAGITIPSDPEKKAALLQQLAVYIEHSDGDKELVKGELVEYKEGVYGIRFHINKFSIFTVVKTDAFLTSFAGDITEVVAPSGAVISGTKIAATVSNKTGSITVKLKVSDKATWRLYRDEACTRKAAGNRMTLKTGSNVAYIRVTAESGAAKTYRLTVTRRKSSEAAIAKVSVPEKAVVKGKTVTANVENAMAALTVQAKVSSRATWKLYSDKECTKVLADNKLKLKAGANTAYIKVTAEDGKTSSTYTLKITRKAAAYDTHVRLGLIGSRDYAETVTGIFKKDYDCANVSVKPEGRYYRITMDFTDRVSAKKACEDMIDREYIIHYYFD